MRISDCFGHSPARLTGWRSLRATGVLGFFLAAWALHCGMSSNPGNPIDASNDHDASSASSGHDADAERSDAANPATETNLEASVDASDDMPKSDAGASDAPASDAGASDVAASDAGESDAGASCAPQSDAQSFAGAARSAGFAGSSQAYNDLFAVSCDSASVCASACVSAGGTAASCASGSACDAEAIPDAGSTCIPPPYWNNPSEALSNSGTTMDAAEITLNGTGETDALILSNFGLSVPDGAMIRGIEIDIRRSSDSGLVADGNIQLVQNGTLVGANRAKAGSWPMTLTYETYGGLGDTWGIAWPGSSLRSSDFGVSISPRYTDTAGNDRAYVDAVRATVFYTSSECD